MRAFIAFELPHSIRQELAALSHGLQHILKGGWLRWVPPDNLHLTLKFLGELPATQLPSLTAELQALARSTQPIPFSLGELGAFPNLARPRVLWVGLQAPPALAQLAAALEQRLLAHGFAAEPRPFTPHLTLARLRPWASGAQVASVAPALPAFSLPPRQSTLSELTLFESQLKATGAVYNALVRMPLRAAKG